MPVKKNIKGADGQQKMTQAYILNISLAISLLTLVVPFIFPLTCQFIIKIFLWPFDLHYYQGKCTFRLAYPQHLDIAKSNSRVAQRRQPMQSNINQQRIHDEDLNTLNNLGLNPFGFYNNMIEINIRINQVAAAQAR